MKLELDLLQYSAPDLIEKGRSLYMTSGVSAIRHIPEASGTWRIKGKATDSFNFVNHPWLVVDSAGRKLLSFGCDCPEVSPKRELCEHCAALCISDMEGLPDYTAPEKYIPPVRPAPLPVLPDVIPEEAPPTVPEETPSVVPEEEVREIRSMELQLGENLQGEPILWHPNDTEQVFHTNVGIIGTMGTGKTQFAKSLLTQLYREQPNNYDGHPLGILIFDYKGDYNETKQDFVQATNAQVLKPYRLPYNPLALNPGKAFKPLLPTHTADEFMNTISQIYNLGPKQQHLLLECIMKAYRAQGILPEKPETWSRQAPTLDQVYNILKAETEGKPADKLMAAMDKLHTFCLFENNPRRAVSLDEMLNGIVVIDISGYDSDIQSTIVAITLNQFYSRMHAQGSSSTDGRYRQLRKFIMVDEADTFMGEDFPSLRKILKEGREFGVGVILSTQSLDHYIGSHDNYSRYVLTWVVHNVSDLKLKDVEYLFRLQPKSPEIHQVYTAIKGLKKHESMVKLGNDDPIVMRNKAFFQL